MNDGDLIWYQQTAGHPGYDYDGDIPGVFIRRTARRTIIVIRLHDGTYKQLAVNPDNVRRRVV